LNDKVSIVVPTRDRRDFLRRTLRSVRRQSWPDIELIVVDEASTDDTDKMLAGEFPEAKLVTHAVPHGPGGARNAGVASSMGDWVLFLDDDDLLHQKHVEELLGAARNLPANCIVSGRWRRFVNTPLGIQLGPIMCAPRDRRDIEMLAEFLEPMGEGSVCTPSVLWPRGLFDTVKWDEQLFTNGDVDFFGSAILAGNHIAGRPVGMAYYRTHSGQRVAGGDTLRSLISAARYRLKWSQLLLSNPERDVCSVAMRNGFMALLTSLASVPEAREVFPFVRDAYRSWGGQSYYLPNPPRHWFKRWIARAILKLGGPTALHLLLKQMANRARVSRSDMAHFCAPANETDWADEAIIRALDEA
jgi:glycosyltransferase involved in cell wall biosynthesis